MSGSYLFISSLSRLFLFFGSVSPCGRPLTFQPIIRQFEVCEGDKMSPISSNRRDPSSVSLRGDPLPEAPVGLSVVAHPPGQEDGLEFDCHAAIRLPCPDLRFHVVVRLPEPGH